MEAFGDLMLGIDLAIGVALLGAMLYFVLVLTVAMARRPTPVVHGPRCLDCAAALVPLLDASRVYHGEAACDRCGALHEGVPWPKEGVWQIDVRARRPEPHTLA